MKNQKKYMPVSVFAQLYEELDEILGKPVVIGGRAVNTLCYYNKRKTFDVDLVLEDNPNNKRTKLIDAGFIVLKENNHRDINSLLNREGYQIDLYYKKPINGINIKDIVDNAIVQNLNNTNIKIVSPAILLLMKYDAGRVKDLEDANNILYNYYDNSEDNFIEKEKALLTKLTIKYSKTESNGKGVYIENRFLRDNYGRIIQKAKSQFLRH